MAAAPVQRWLGVTGMEVSCAAGRPCMLRLSPPDTTDDLAESAGHMVEWSELLSGLVGSLIGGGLAIIGTVWGAHLQHKAQLKLDHKAGRAEISGYLGALHAEMTVLWGSYQARVRPALAAVEDGQVFEFNWPARYDYFPFYRARLVDIRLH